MPRTLALLAFAVAVALFTAAPAHAGVPDGATWKEAYIETPGQPTLHLDVLRPKGIPADRKTPVILTIGPYNGHSGQTTPGETPEGGPQEIYTELWREGKAFQRGYTIVQADLRGFGGSTGCNDFGGPGEQNDVKRAVEWAASQPWSTGKVGMWGKSYDAWTQVMALDEKPKGLAAAIIQAPIIDGYRTLYQNGVHYDTGWYVTPALYQEIDAIPPTPSDSTEYWLGFAQGTNPACYAQNIALQNTTLDGDAPFWKERELPAARGSDVPVFWSHGFLDANTKPDNFMPVWATLKGPARAWFGQYAHDRFTRYPELIGRKGAIDETMRFLDRYVLGDTRARVEDDPRVEVQDGDGKWRGEAQWPPADAQLRTVAVRGGTVTDSPRNAAEAEFPGSTSGVGVWSITKPFPYEARIAGVPRIRLDVSTSSPRAHLFALLYAIDDKNVARLISRAAHVVRSADKKLDFELYPQDWRIPAGHRLGLLLSGSDLDWYKPPHSGQSIAVAGGTLEVPFLRHQRTAFLTGSKAGAQSGVKPIAVPAAALAEAPVAADLPPAMTAMPVATPAPKAMSLPPAATPRPAPRAATTTSRRAALRLTVRVRGRRLVIKVRGATGKVRLALRRGKRTLARRTTRRASAVLRAPRRGRYTVTATAADGRTVSRRIRVR